MKLLIDIEKIQAVIEIAERGASRVEKAWLVAWSQELNAQIAAQEQAAADVPPVENKENNNGTPVEVS